jgi:hypothetical protein
VDVTEPVGPVGGKALSKSAVSRRFKAATEKATAELLARDLSELDVAVVMVDGLNVAWRRARASCARPSPTNSASTPSHRHANSTKNSSPGANHHRRAPVT